MAGGLTPLTFCNVLVHEIGHLAGQLHSATAGDIMNGEGDLRWTPCVRAVTPPLTVVAVQELRSELPAPRAAWRIACSPGRGSARKCVARRGTTVKRYVVSRVRGSVSVVAEG
jgi:hypothetical protein